MKPRRGLALRREHLTDLSSGDLRSMVGGTHLLTACDCVSHGASCDACPTPTLPVNDCTTVLGIGSFPCP